MSWATLALLVATAQLPWDGGNEISAGIGTVSYSGFFRGGSPVLTGVIAYHRFLGEDAESGRPVRIGLGFRFGQPNTSPLPTPRFPLEIFLQLQLSARIGLWEPVVGPEAGMSGLTELGRAPSPRPWDMSALEQTRVGLAYVAFTASPFRLHWRWLVVEGPSLTLGTTLTPAGASTRTELSFLSVGVTL